MFPKDTQIVATAVLHKAIYFKIAQKVTTSLDTFVSKFVAKNFLKSPNLVKLVTSHMTYLTYQRVNDIGRRLTAC